MRKKIYAALMALPMFMSTLVGCSAFHVHTVDSPWESNETSHWKTCKVCHEKFEEHKHTFNTFNDKCFICDYVDPLVEINEGGEITRLTEYGKTKLVFNVPHKVNGIPVIGIGPDAFNGSQALTVKLNEELEYYYRDSFTNSSIRIINTEEDLVKWTQPDKDGKISKIRVLDDNVAMVGDKYYPTLAKAFDAVSKDDTTITLLRDELEIEDAIEVKYSVSLVSFYARTNLKCNFNIDTTGILYIPETINYSGDVKLILGITDEERANKYYADEPNVIESVNTSGSVVFVNKEECPKNVNVSYTHTFGSGEEGIPAHGAVQIVNDAIVALPKKHFAYGTFTFDEGFLNIKGLTKYGLTVNGLNITKVAEHVDANIGDFAFSVGVRVDLSLATLHLFKTKGLFFDLTIGEGIKKVGYCAFNSRADTDLDKETLEAIAPIISHLSSITIGPDVEDIDSWAFYGNVYLSNVGGGEGLTTIGYRAFKCCYNLKSVELSHARKLVKLESEAFKDCSSLIYLNLPAGIWRYGSEEGNFGYFPYDVTPEKIAYCFASGSGSDSEWYNYGPFNLYPYSYTDSLDKDVSGAYNDVKYTTSLEIAMDECEEGGEIYISENKNGEEKVLYYDDIEANLTITAAPGVENIRIAQNETTDDITINSESSDKHLILSNVKPKGKIILKAKNNEGVTKQTAGFAIRGVRDEDLPKVDLITDDGQIEIPDLVGSESIIRGVTYDHTYGMFNFKVDESKNTTYIHDTSPFGDTVQAMTIARQTEKAAIVELVDRPEPTNYGNDVINLTLSKDVKKVGDYFFAAYGDKGFNKVEKLVCEEGLTSIGESAFDGCDGLVTVSLPNSVKTIGNFAFQDCNELATINIPTGLETIPERCFYNCPKLESIEIPDNVTSIESEAFLECKSLKDITFGKGLKSIGTRAFSSCMKNGIGSLEFPKSLISIGEEAFSGCQFLISAYLPDDSALEEIGAKAFNSCPLLRFFYFANNIKGWKAGEYEFDPELHPDTDDLSNEYIVATNLRETYVGVKWTREIQA